MQLFIGGASAGKRNAVRARFPNAVWWRLAPGQRLRESISLMRPSTPFVLHGVFDWLNAVLDSDLSSDEWRNQWRTDLIALLHAADTHSVTLVIIINDIGRGIVPIERNHRRLRDLTGWFSQDVAAQAKQVWYVRHGLVQALNDQR